MSSREPNARQWMHLVGIAEARPRNLNFLLLYNVGTEGQLILKDHWGGWQILLEWQELLLTAKTSTLHPCLDLDQGNFRSGGRSGRSCLGANWGCVRGFYTVYGFDCIDPKHEAWLLELESWITEAGLLFRNLN